MHPLHRLALLAIAAVALSLCGVARAQPPGRPGVSVFRGRVDAIERRDSAAFWQLAVRVAPAGRTSGLVLVGVAAGRSVVRDPRGRLTALPGARVGDSVTAWAHGWVLLSDPPIAFAESLCVAR